MSKRKPAIVAMLAVVVIGALVYGTIATIRQHTRNNATFVCRDFHQLSFSAQHQLLQNLGDYVPTPHSRSADEAPRGLSFDTTTCDIKYGPKPSLKPTISKTCSKYQLSTPCMPADLQVCRPAGITPAGLKAILRDDVEQGLPTAEVNLRRNLRVDLPTGLCDSRPLCANLGRLTTKQLIGVTDLAAFYPHQFNPHAAPHGSRAVINPVTCAWGFAYDTPDALVKHFNHNHPGWRSDINCQPPKDGLCRCHPFPGTE